MDIPIGTVKSRIFRGRRMLREMLDGYGKEHGYVREKSMEVVA
jgi:RNA polymerase sigma-70 factor (ECF subfamily)